jgi:hypothetical protein
VGPAEPVRRFLVYDVVRVCNDTFDAPQIDLAIKRLLDLSLVTLGDAVDSDEPPLLFIHRLVADFTQWQYEADYGTASPYVPRRTLQDVWEAGWLEGTDAGAYSSDFLPKVVQGVQELYNLWATGISISRLKRKVGRDGIALPLVNDLVTGDTYTDAEIEDAHLKSLQLAVAESDPTSLQGQNLQVILLWELQRRCEKSTKEGRAAARLHLEQGLAVQRDIFGKCPLPDNDQLRMLQLVREAKISSYVAELERLALLDASDN